MKPFLFASLLAFASTLCASENSALTALNSLPSKYRDGVLKLSADNADPNPETWYVVAQAAGSDSNIHNITIEGGEVVSNKRTLGLREIFSQVSPVTLDKVRIDSGAAFDIVQNYARANGRTVGSVSFVLQQKGAASTPVWSVWCYARDGRYLGLLQLLATDGTVISNDAFPQKP